MLALDKWDQLHVILASDDEDAFAGVPLGVRVLKDVEQVPTPNVENDVLEFRCHGP